MSVCPVCATARTCWPVDGIRWRSVKEDGFPESGEWVLVTNGKATWVAQYVNGMWGGIHLPDKKRDRWIPLAELRKLPGGE